jgi:hypothetical protein
MTQDDIDFLEKSGWTVECESPLEIRENESGGFATGNAAKLVLESLREDEKKKNVEFVLNERVRLIMVKAFDDAQYPEEQEYRIEPNPYFCAKFAELIVKECVSIPFDMWDKAELNADIAVKIENRVKEHFGIND